MESLALLLLNPKRVARCLRAQHKRLLREKRRNIRVVEKLMELKLWADTFFLEPNSYYARLLRHLHHMAHIVLDDLRQSPDLFPKVRISKALIDLLTEINRGQEKQQRLVESMLHHHHHHHHKRVRAPPTHPRAAAAAATDDDDDPNFHNQLRFDKI